jgi:hypothetical protein
LTPLEQMEHGGGRDDGDLDGSLTSDAALVTVGPTPADTRRHGMMDDQLDSGRKDEAPQQGDDGDVTAETVTITRAGAGSVRGTRVTMRQAGARSVSADELIIRQGGAVRAEVGHLEMHQGGVMLCRAESASLTASQAGAVLARGDVNMDQAGARVLLARGSVTMDQGGAIVLASREVRANQCGAVFLVAGRVEGTVDAVFDLRESAGRAAAVGAAAGGFLALLAMALLRPRLSRARRR